MTSSIGDASDRATVAALVKLMRQRLLDGKHDPSAGHVARTWNIDVDSDHDAATRLAMQLPEDGLGPETHLDAEGPFISRNPLVSVLQSEMTVVADRHGRAVETPPGHRDHGFFARIWEGLQDLIEDGRIAEHDAEFGAEYVEGVLGRIAEGTHAFNPEPVICQIGDPARIVVVGDWGSGSPQARAVAALMAAEVTAGTAAGRDVHVIHLGDVYFAGQAEEYRDHVLAEGCWPVTDAQADAGVGSWALAGNHDLYGGATPYFNELLGDRRFRRQQSDDGKPTSWFRLEAPAWQIIGLDSSWNDDPFFKGDYGLLQAPQAATVTQWLQDDQRPGVLLSHHQFMSAFDPRLTNAPQTPPLVADLAELVNQGRVAGWLWGHEHRCMAFTHETIRFPRLVGHGGQLESPIPAGTALPATVRWAEQATFEYGGRPWGRCGAVVLDIDGAQIQARYLLDGAAPTVATETFEVPAVGAREVAA